MAREADSAPHGSVDTQLVALVRAGSGDAFAQLFDRYANRVYQYCLRRTADHGLAEDLMSATFLEAWRRASAFTLVDGSALPWLLGIATNVLRNQRRSLRRYRAALGRYATDANVPSTTSNVDALSAEREHLSRVLAALRKLPRIELEVVVLCVWEGLSSREASQALGVPEPTVRTRLARARARLRRHLAGSEGGPAAVRGGTRT